MKNENVITEKWFRVSDHKAMAIRMIGEGDNAHFEIEQLFSNEIIPIDKQKRIKVTGANVKMGLEKNEFIAVLNIGIDFFRLIREQTKKPE
jgi:hypothetical protein